ncbi:MAG: Ig-like domain-containing protein [Spirochaetia bacterium]|nr:Ig-like domain-containing protein [Spirochaetota bacterium]MDW8112565.1 Ig-like domain-containing protein [Spirochaetia bacterium]
MRFYKILLILTLALFVVWGYFGCSPTPEQQQQGGGQQGGGGQQQIQDTNRPTITITSPANNSTNNTSNITVSGTASDTNGSGNTGVKEVFIRVGTSGSFYKVTGTTNWSTNITLSDGSYTIQAYAVDNANNTSVTQSVTFVIDATKPTVTISSPANNSTVPSGFSVSGTANDAGTGLKAVYLRVGTSGAFGQVSGTSSWSTNLNITTSGLYTIQVYAEDNAGNVSSTNSINITVDINFPVVEIGSPGTNSSIVLTNVTSLAVSGTALNTATVFYRLGTTGIFSIASGTSSWSTPSLTLTSGTNIVQVFATNAAGMSSSTQQIIIVVDNNPPSIAISSPSDNDIVPASFSVSGTANDTGVSGLKAVYLRVGTSGGFGQVSGTSSWSTNLNITTSGSYTIQVYSVDNVGNTSSTSSINITVDATPPTVSISSPANGSTVPGIFTVSGSANDTGGAGLQAVFLRVGTSGGFGQVSGTSSWSTNLNITTSGSYTIQVYSVDNVGNTSSTSSINITVDATPPTVSISSPANNSTITNNLPAGGVLIQGTASDNIGVAQVYVSVDGGPFQLATGTTSWSRLVRNLRETTINIVAYSVDTVGNHSTTNTNTVTNNATFLGTGEYNFWASQIKDVYVKSGSGQLTIDIIINNTATDDHNLYVFVDITNMTTGHQPTATGWSGDWTTGWGNFWFTNSAGINADLVIWGWLRNSSGSGGSRALGATNANKIVGTASSVSVSHSMTSIGGGDYKYSFVVSYANIGSGASSGQVANVYVLYGRSGGTAGEEGMRSIYPSGVSRTGAGAWGPYISDITNKSIDYVLNP